jgi:hypothetical protein
LIPTERKSAVGTTPDVSCPDGLRELPNPGTGVVIETFGGVALYAWVEFDAELGKIPIRRSSDVAADSRPLRMGDRVVPIPGVKKADAGAD